MPIPPLLKRLSAKSLRKRTQSPSRSATSTPTPPRSDTPPVPSLAQKQISATVIIPTPPQTPPALASIPPDDALSKDLQGAWASANAAPNTSRADRLLLAAENAGSAAVATQTQAVPYVSGVKTALDAVGGLEVIEKGLNTFMEGMPVLMKALDEVAKLHPFIGVAVMAFKAVWALEQKRRDNDKKILALHMEMKEMMGVLTQLRNVKDADEVAPDGSTIKGRMQIIILATAEDIKACANACDTYCKKKLIVKVLKGPIWEGRLVAFVGAFTKRRTEFEFALSIHTALGFDAATRLIGTVDDTTQEINAKMDMMLKLFQKLVPPEQREMAQMVEKKGGQSVMDNDKALKDLNDFENKMLAAQGGGPGHGGKAVKTPDLNDLKEELHGDPQLAMDQNMTVFSRKFEVQKRQIIDELSRVVEREGDRVISAVTAGPHDRIIDPNVHMIWKEMGWRGSVKARHFVMALRDHFQEHTDHVQIEQTEVWALEYLSITRIQAISEAFDDDASGFITVAEANDFTTGRPLDWSLPRWIAYWAVGQHQTTLLYAFKIRDLLSKMFSILPHALPENKSAANSYMDDVYYSIWTVVSSLTSCNVNLALQSKFESYVEDEEARLKANLEAIKYDIDADDTLELITGRGRIDRYVFPVIYLLLERHFEILRLCQTKVVHPDELWDAADTIVWVFDAIGARFRELESIFKQQNLDLKQQFKTFAFGMYEYVNEPNLLWAPKLVQEADFTEFPYNDALEGDLPDAANILNYPVDQDDLDYAAYSLDSCPSAPAETALPGFEDLFSATWHGFLYMKENPSRPSSGMISLDLKPTHSEAGIQLFATSGRANRSDFTLSGECNPSTHSLKFKRSFPARLRAQYFNGTWDPAAEMLSGTLGFEEDPNTHSATFVFKRLAPQHTRFMPSPGELEDSRPRALWKFAISAVSDDIGRDRWSWRYFKARKERRLRFIELYIRSAAGSAQSGRPLSSAEFAEFAELKRMTTADSRFYHSLAERTIRNLLAHDCRCDACDGDIGGARVSCLECQMKDTWNTVDFHESPECMDERVTRDDMERPHLPQHDLVKTRRVVHMRQFGKTFREAKAAVTKARSLLSDESEPRVCRMCKVAVVQPCWFCVQCEEPTFLCRACDEKGEIALEGHVYHEHDLVRLVEKSDEDTMTVEERFSALESQFTVYQKSVEERLQKLEDAVDGRLVRVEKLLEQLLARSTESV
ncbi:unnamed protein product [Mycena citricolor]|uniref:Vacuolar protein sorting-associated protein 13 second N-terminal domain-containing protein n=1 Tax=Mycena citricolor TaxID=2018698 RepID=A0AAD2HQM2_9AGAR|nr:unnamed protein product [Mycena citricolor]